MSNIKIKCSDQRLHVLNNPEIYSGDVNYDSVTFEFCEKWTDFLKTAVFYRSKDEVYYQLLDLENTCVIPKEVLQTKGVLYFGVFGTKDDTVITSEILRYRIYEGILTEDLQTPDINPDIYQQILSDYNSVKVQLQTDYEEAKAGITAIAEELQLDFDSHKTSGDHDDRYHTKGEVEEILSGHNHDDRYYTETEVDSKLEGKAESSHTHDDRYYTESEIDTKLKGKSDTSHTHSWDNIQGKPSTFSPSSHKHDDRYYTETEVDNLLGVKQGASWGVIHTFTHQSGGMGVDKSLTAYNEITIMLTYAGVDIYQTINLPKSSVIGGQKVCLTNGGSTKAIVELTNSNLSCEIMETGYYVSILGR